MKISVYMCVAYVGVCCVVLCCIVIVSVSCRSDVKFILEMHIVFCKYKLVEIYWSFSFAIHHSVSKTGELLRKKVIIYDTFFFIELH